MFERLSRAHRRTEVALGLAVASLAAWTALLALGVGLFADGRPVLLACIGAVAVLFNRPLDAAFELLSVSMLVEQRRARLRVIRARRARLARPP